MPSEPFPHGERHVGRIVPGVIQDAQKNFLHAETDAQGVPARGVVRLKIALNLIRYLVHGGGVQFV